MKAVLSENLRNSETKLRQAESVLLGIKFQKELAKFNPTSEIQNVKFTENIPLILYYRDVIDSQDAYSFQAAVKYHYAEDFSLYLSILHANILYKNEVHGNSSRLIITPLTDRIFQTISMSIINCLGTSLQGPAGTGKTETSKDFSIIAGRMYLVFQCSESIGVESIARMLLDSVSKFENLDQFSLTNCWLCRTCYINKVPRIFTVNFFQSPTLLPSREYSTWGLVAIR